MPSHFVLSAIRIQDFRVIADAVIDLDPEETILIGENNAGKSAVLSALDVAIGGAEAGYDDLHIDGAGSRSASAMIDVLIVPGDPGTGFADDVADLFGAAVLQPAGDPPTERIALRCLIERVAADERVSVRHRFLTGWADARAEAAGLSVVAGEAGRVGPAHRRAISYSLLDASRDLVAELRNRRTTVGRILSDLGIDPADEAALAASLASLGSEITTKSRTLTNLSAALERLATALATGADAVTVHSLPPDVRELGRTIDITVTAPGSADLPLRLQGSGSRSLTSLLVFRSLVDLRVAATATIADPLAVVGVEEPEAHLHPQAQAAAYRQVEDLPGQRVIATHSIAIPRLADPRRLRRLSRSGDSVRLSSLRSASDKAVTTFRTHVLRYRPEVVYARLVIIVEGATEEPALREYLRIRWPVDPEGAGVHVASADGAGQVAHVAEALNSLQVDWLALVDADTAGTDALAGLQKLVGRDPLAGPVLAFSTGEKDLEHMAVARHRTECIDLVVAETGGDAARHAKLTSGPDAHIVENLKGLKPRWGPLLSERLLSARTPMAVFEDISVRAAVMRGVAL